MSQYKVIHQLERTIPVNNQISQYNDLNIKLEYDDENKLAFVIHMINLDSSSISADDCINESKNQLGLFWQILEFYYGMPIRFKNISCIKDKEKGIQTTQIQLPSSGAVVKDVSLPSERILKSPPIRISVWLYFINIARNLPLKEGSIKLYYSVIEDIKHGVTLNEVENKIRFARNFVSHGFVLKDQPLLNYLKEKIGEDVNQYNPHDNKHARFVNDHYELAREYTEKILKDKIEKYGTA